MIYSMRNINKLIPKNNCYIRSYKLCNYSFKNLIANIFLSGVMFESSVSIYCPKIGGRCVSSAVLLTIGIMFE